MKKQSRFRLLYRVMGISISLWLTACSHLNSDFSCARQPGVMCQSLDQVNAMVDGAGC